jgi:hypothetical protein
MVLSWLTGWSQRHPIPLVKGIHTKDHPFVKNYDTSDGIDIGKLVQGRIRWVDSRESWGIQMADIGATIVSQAAYALDDRSGDISLCGALMRSSPYGPTRGPRLFTPLGDVPDHVGGKYRLLSEIMERRRVSAQPT